MSSSISRRMLVKAVAGTSMLGFPTIVPSSVFGRDAPSNTLNIAAIGTGSRASSNILGNLAKRPPAGAKLRVACDCFKHKRDRFADAVNQIYGSNYCEPIADFREVLQRDDVDGVAISTQDHWHVPLAYHAALAGKDMYVEKPLGTAMTWAWKLRRAVADHHVIFQYGTQQRSGGGFKRAVELVRNGYIGTLQRIECWCPDMSTQTGHAHVKPYGSTTPTEPPADMNYEMWIGPAPMKPYTVDRCTNLGGFHIYDYALGFIAGWGAHPLDIAQWGMDADATGPIAYEGVGKIPPVGSLWDTIESWDVTCRYANGVQMRFMDHRAARPIVQKMSRRPWRDHGTTFYGDEGWVSVDRGGCYLNLKGEPVNAYKFELKPSDWRAGGSNNQVHN